MLKSLRTLLRKVIGAIRSAAGSPPEEASGITECETNVPIPDAPEATSKAAVSVAEELFPPFVPTGPHPAKTEAKAPARTSPPFISTAVVEARPSDAVAQEDAAQRLQRRVEKLHGHAEEILNRAEEMLHRGLGALAFDAFRSKPDDRAVFVDCEPEQLGDIWFIGDLHGDLLALEFARQYILSTAQEGTTTLVFLGDLFDDGGHGYEVLLEVFRLMAKHPGRVALIAGNHDEGLAFDGKRFTSSVEPGDFAEWLNQHRDDPLATRCGRLAIRLFEAAPRALFFPDGLVVAHGGIPHGDLWRDVTDRATLNAPQCLQDFVWTRASAERRKLPNRMTRGCEYGYEDFYGFCAHINEALGFPAKRMIRGHDHVERRFEQHANYVECPVLTINTLSRRLARETGAYERIPCVARWIHGRLPEVHRLRVPKYWVRQVYPEPPKEGAG